MDSNFETSKNRSTMLLRYLSLSKTKTPLHLSGRATKIDLFETKLRTNSISNFLNRKLLNKQKSLKKVEMEYFKKELLNSSGGYTIHNSLNLCRIKLQYFARLLSGPTVKKTIKFRSSQRTETL